MMEFRDMKMPKALIRALDDMGEAAFTYSRTSVFRFKAGRNVNGIAQTGTGKDVGLLVANIESASI